KSLRLPEDIAGTEVEPKHGYPNFPGKDEPGDTRKAGAAFVPMVSVARLSDINRPAPSAVYHDRSTGQWMQYVGGSWVPVSQQRIDQMLEDKAYIDMPNLETFTFLNPRNVFYGIRVSFDF
ncbi:MAG: hypothetical protein AAB393_04555, partial [Bacteroidota bacterium]